MGIGVSSAGDVKLWEVGFPKNVSVRSHRLRRLKSEHSKFVIRPPLPGVPQISFSLGFL